MSHTHYHFVNSCLISQSATYTELCRIRHLTYCCGRELEELKLHFETGLQQVTSEWSTRPDTNPNEPREQASTGSPWRSPLRSPSVYSPRPVFGKPESSKHTNPVFDHPQVHLTAVISPNGHTRSGVECGMPGMVESA